MSESLKQNDVDAILNQLQDGNKALAADTQALEQAAQTASEIAGDIHTHGTAATPAPQEPDPSAPTAAPPIYSREIQSLLAIEVPVIVQLGVRRMNVGEVIRLAVGAIIEFSKAADEELELLANNKSIGKGHAVKVGENFGIKLTGISPVKDTIRKLGAA